MRIPFLLTTVLLFGAQAADAHDIASAPPATPLRIIIPIVEPKCETPPPSDGVIVVCGRKDQRYRIDPTVLAAVRSRDSRGGARSDPHVTMFTERCGPVGIATCPGQNVIPVTSILMVALTAIDTIARGEDIRPMLHTVPDEYALYKEAKAIADAKDSPTGK